MIFHTKATPTKSTLNQKNKFLKKAIEISKTKIRVEKFSEKSNSVKKA